MLFCETVKGEYETHLGCLDFQQSIDMCIYSVCLMDTSMHTVRLQDHVVVSLYIMCKVLNGLCILQTCSLVQVWNHSTLCMLCVSHVPVEVK